MTAERSLPIGYRLRQSVGPTRYEYELVASTPHVRRDGRPSAILTWCGSCAVCSVAFTLTSGTEPGRHLARTCPAHRGALAYTPPQTQRRAREVAA